MQFLNRAKTRSTPSCPNIEHKYFFIGTFDFVDLPRLYTSVFAEIRNLLVHPKFSGDINQRPLRKLIPDIFTLLVHSSYLIVRWSLKYLNRNSLFSTIIWTRRAMISELYQMQVFVLARQCCPMVFGYSLAGIQKFLQHIIKLVMKIYQKSIIWGLFLYLSEILNSTFFQQEN